MTHALIIGKFYPPHKGHHYLIDTALKECDEVTVLVLAADVETISRQRRVAWIKENHPKAAVISAVDNHPVKYNEETWELHMGVIYDAIWPRGITHVFSSEKYGEELARRLSGKWTAPSGKYDDLGEVKNRCVDLDRAQTNGASATSVREHTRENWHLLSAAVKRSLAHRIVVCGAESSGSTTLARDLAGNYDTTWAFEFGRYFCEMIEAGNIGSHEYIHEDFMAIAYGQIAAEKEMVERSRRGLMFCDTDLYTTAMYHRLWLPDAGPKQKELDRLLAIKREDYPASLYIITDHKDIPFEDDSTRRNETDRPWQEYWLEGRLKADKRNFIKVSGDEDDRISQATKAIDRILKWEFGVPLEYQEK